MRYIYDSVEGSHFSEIFSTFFSRCEPCSDSALQALLMYQNVPKFPRLDKSHTSICLPQHFPPDFRQKWRNISQIGLANLILRELCTFQTMFDSVCWNGPFEWQSERQLIVATSVLSLILRLLTTYLTHPTSNMNKLPDFQLSLFILLTIYGIVLLNPKLKI